MNEIKDPNRTGNNAAKPVESGVKGVVDAVRDNAKGAMDTAGDYADQAKTQVRQWAGDVKNAAVKAEDRVEHWAGDAARATADTAGEFGNEMTALVRKYPIQALLVGFGVGMLCGRAVKA